MNKKLGLGLIAAAALVASPATATQKAKNIAITPSSDKGAIIFKSPNLPPPPTFASAWKLLIKRYDPAAQNVEGTGSFSGLWLASKPGLFAQDYLVADIKPGTYVMLSFSRQDLWSLCFNGASLQFTIRPGEVLYLGEFDPGRHIAELEARAVATGRLTARSGIGQDVPFFDTVLPPAFAPTDDVGLAAVSAMMKTEMPRTTVAPKAVSFAPAKFGTGSDLFGMTRICGGYFTKPAK